MEYAVQWRAVGWVAGLQKKAVYWIYTFRLVLGWEGKATHIDEVLCDRRLLIHSSTEY